MAEIAAYVFGSNTSRTFKSSSQIVSSIIKTTSLDITVRLLQSVDDVQKEKNLPIHCKKYILLYPVTYRTMCGTTKLWLEKHGESLKGKEVIAVGFGGSDRSANAFESDFVAIMSGIGAIYNRRNTMVVSEEDTYRAIEEIIKFGETQ